ncbi:ATP-binding protein [Burkholderia sp. Tr-862]|uniref:ATP-binding protein n=1 Tax=Burkholderia sp. Tr-862 TaxID=2608331 RepID=UPI001419920E|nr:ATP-binding protein [Burkholderia sp. Tr-862]NIF42512.1 ATP-binding protein [Burkholderia sp. Tr-862]
MNRLVHFLGNIVRRKVQDAALQQPADRLESRFIFHGPPLDLLEQVFNELVIDGGIKIVHGQDAVEVTLPVLLQLPQSNSFGSNPGIGESGKCNESHLLHIRNDPNIASFVALMPPGQHNNRSVASTTEEFGLSASSNTGHATFEEWWEDEFVQLLVMRGLEDAHVSAESLAEAKLIVKQAAAAVDEVDPSEGCRVAVWRLLSRLYSIGGNALGLPSGSALALACGTPPMPSGGIDAKSQVGILEKVADELADGFKTSIDRLVAAATSESIRHALFAFLSHVQGACEVPTAFGRATPAFYLPSDTFELAPPPQWWRVLTSECWAELLAEDPDGSVEDLTIRCTNPILPIVRGMPAIVRTGVELCISTGSIPNGETVEVLLSGGSHGKAGIPIHVAGEVTHHDIPPVVAQRSPISYKATANSGKAATCRVISLAAWLPGILVTARMATKLSPPKKPKRGGARADWETALSLPGSGRHELMLLVSPDATITKAEGVPDDATEQSADPRQVLQLHQSREGEYQIEIEAEGKYQLEISFRPPGRDGIETCKVYITCEETKEEGCRSEFERLIKANRRHLERFDTKAVVQVDRHARSSSIQAWILDEQNVDKSFVPMVLSDDYVTKWMSPDWSGSVGPVLSDARFLHDPRPIASQFVPPQGFVEARKEIAKRIRATSDFAGLVESAPLGKWMAQEPDFRSLVEKYLESYTAWLAADRDVACWVDVVAVCPREADGRTLARVPDAILLSPLHPLRLAWHCLAQQVLYESAEGSTPHPCPAASILDPDCIPDLLVMSLQAPGGPSGIDQTPFLSVECSSDYWSVLWNGLRLGQIAEKSSQAPFDGTFGLVVGGISSGFSPAQVARALEDVSDLLSAKPIVSLVVSSGGAPTDACNEGLAVWCAKRFGNGENASQRESVGTRVLEIFDVRPESSRPDQAAIASLSEDTANNVRWFDDQPPDTKPDLGIIAQLDSAQPEYSVVGVRSPLGTGGLIRHRVRRQLHGTFLSESRQARPMPPSGEVFADKVANCISVLEGGYGESTGLQFAPNVHAVSGMLEEQKADFVAVSSSAIDPACFLGGWIKGTYLWDYDLPSYSHRAGDTSGYYLLSQVRDADRDALSRVLQPLRRDRALSDGQVEQILLEVARRGIPTVRGLSGDDTGATGDLGLFLAVRLLQDQFRTTGNLESILPVLSGSPEDACIAIIIPVDPFRGYLSDIARSLGKERREASMSRPDLLVAGLRVSENNVRIHLTPIEVKCRQRSTVLSPNEAKDALAQARALSTLLTAMEERASMSLVWKLAYQHLLLSMIGFGLRVYSQHELVKAQAPRWAGYHERIAGAILGPAPVITVDPSGRLIVADGSSLSDAHDRDDDGFCESIFVSPGDAGRIIGDDAQEFYDAVRSKVGDWRLLPSSAGTIRLDTEDAACVSPPAYEGSSNIEASTADSLAVPDAARREMNAQGTSAASQQATTEVAEDASCSGIILSVGKTVDGFEPRPISLNISDTRLNQLNIGVVGDLGTGKTQLLKSLIYQITSASSENRNIKPRFLIFDYKRDYSNPEFIEATGARIVRPVHLPLNLFDTSSMGESVAPWLDRFRFFADVLDKVYAGIGPVQRDKLKGAVRNAYEASSIRGGQPTIYDIHAEYRELLGGKSDSPMAIIDDLVDMAVFERDPTKTKPFDEFLDGVVVVSLDAMGQDDRSKNMLVAIMLNMFYENMLRTPKRPFIGNDPQLRVIDSYLLVDEADNIMRYEFDVLRKLLLQGREFGTGVILASQYLRHFKASTTDYREPLLTWFIHKVPNVTPAELGALGFTSDLGELSERVKTLRNHHCLYKSFDVSGEVIRGLPFYELDRDSRQSA